MKRERGVKVDKNSLYGLICISLMAMLFCTYALYLGYDTVIIGGLMAFLGTIAGYIYGRKEEAQEES